MKSYSASLLLSIVFFSHCYCQNSFVWQQITQLQYKTVTCFLETTDGSLFVGGHGRSLFRSTDGGQTWENTNGMIMGDTVQSLASTGKYIFVGTNQGIFRSSDKGASWETANSGLNPNSIAIAQISTIDTTVYVAAMTSGIFRSTNFGNSWTALNDGLVKRSINTGGTIYYYPDPAVGVAATPNGIFATQMYEGAFKLSPGDTTWNYVGLGTYSLMEGALIAVDTALFSGSGSMYIYSGHDTTWIPRNTGLPEFMPSCLLTAVQNILFLYFDRKIYMTSDLGVTWTRIDGNNFSTSSITSVLATKKFLFVSTEINSWRLPISNLLSSAQTSFQITPENYILHQNYPNPFNPSTTISFDLPVQSFVTVKIFDLLGREVATLASEELSAGNHSRQWNATELGSGVYFYRLQSDKFTAVKKLLLEK